MQHHITIEDMISADMGPCTSASMLDAYLDTARDMAPRRYHRPSTTGQRAPVDGYSATPCPPCATWTLRGRVALVVGRGDGYSTSLL